LKSLFLTKQAFLFSSGAAQSLRFVSPPFFSNPSFLSWGYFFIGTPCSQARFAAFSFAQSGIALESFENPVSNETGFFVLY
jgi:hypothetical protein